MSEDILNERHVETQTCYRSYRKVTAALKRRHQREMLRLKRQTRLMKRQLTSQCKYAKEMSHFIPHELLKCFQNTQMTYIVI